MGLEGLNLDSKGPADSKPSGKSKTTPTLPPSSLNTGPTSDVMETFERLPGAKGARIAETQTAEPSRNGCQSMLFAEVSPAKTSRWPVPGPDSTGNDRLFGEKCSGSFAKLGPDGSWLKTSQGSCQLMTDGSLENFSGTWPQRGLMRNGECYPRPEWEPRTLEDGCSLWPTVRSTDGDRGGRGDLIQAIRGNENSHFKMWPTPVSHPGTNRRMKPTPAMIRGEAGINLAAAVKMWPTPSAADGMGGPGNSGRSGGPKIRTAVKFATPQARDFRTGEPHRWSSAERSRNLNDQIGGQLNADWVDLLMGFPLGYTNVADGNAEFPGSRKGKRTESSDSGA